jgi:hypothetical protein
MGIRLSVPEAVALYVLGVCLTVYLVSSSSFSGAIPGAIESVVFAMGLSTILMYVFDEKRKTKKRQKEAQPTEYQEDGV